MSWVKSRLKLGLFCLWAQPTFLSHIFNFWIKRAASRFQKRGCSGFSSFSFTQPVLKPKHKHRREFSPLTPLKHLHCYSQYMEHTPNAFSLVKGFYCENKSGWDDSFESLEVRQRSTDTTQNWNKPTPAAFTEILHSIWPKWNKSGSEEALVRLSWEKPGLWTNRTRRSQRLSTGNK